MNLAGRLQTVGTHSRNLLLPGAVSGSLHQAADPLLGPTKRLPERFGRVLSGRAVSRFASEGFSVGLAVFEVHFSQV